ncbi:hypothetical protein SmJEL517_g00679 [Synchytrium microbalum]|uniref:Uncharacterized protein n=1 Tax=Synchytrium microbalum TaxID=1806994 RepID=A0A507CIM2_9FUNG|nr:uncharacterized protein SmJEL517_g00679 [Synchytrium microbalum]TPX37575.1 hypothetical protein SmJEL517_g00679 [Synchytrium microbalum]
MLASNRKEKQISAVNLHRLDENDIAPSPSRSSKRESSASLADDIGSLSNSELVERLVEAYQRLTETEENLVLAAQYGNDLLTQNGILKERLNASLSAADPTITHRVFKSQLDPADAKHIEDIEKSNVELNSKLERLQHDLEVANHRGDREARKGLEHVEGSKRHLEAATRRIAELEEERKEWLRERTGLVRSRRDSVAPIKDFDAERRELLQRVDELEESICQLSTNLEQSQTSLAQTERNCHLFETKSAELEALLQEYREYREDAERATEQVACLSQQLEQAHDIIDELKSVKSDGTQPLDQTGEDEGSRTLFGEVDSKRRELEEKHVMLARRHQGLMKAHEGAISQQERMRMHLARLAQIASANGTVSSAGEDKYTVMQRALAQSEAECRDLRDRVAALERAKDSPLSLQSDDSAQDEVVQLLRLHVTQLKHQCRQARKASQTSDLLRVSEMERARSLESSLVAKNAELQRATAGAVRLGFELDAAKAKIKLLLSTREEVVHVLVVGGKDKWHRATQTEVIPSHVEGEKEGTVREEDSTVQNEVSLDHDDNHPLDESIDISLWPETSNTPEEVAIPSSTATSSTYVNSPAVSPSRIIPIRPDTPTTPRSSVFSPMKDMPKHVQVHVESGRTQVGECAQQ